MTIKLHTAESNLHQDFCDVDDPRKMFAKFATGVAVLLGRCPKTNNLHGLTINSFSSLSLDPLLIMFSIKTTSKFYELTSQVSQFSINILSEEQKYLSSQCSRHGGGVPDSNELASSKGFDYITNVITAFGCTLHKKVEGGDHSIFVCSVNTELYKKDGRPLVFYNSNYRKLSAEE